MLRVGVLMDFLLVARLLHLHDGARFDEQAGDFDGFAQRAAAVVAQVDDQQVDAVPWRGIYRALSGTSLAVLLKSSSPLEAPLKSR